MKYCRKVEKETHRRAECLPPTSFGAFSYVNEGGSRELLNLNTNLGDLELSEMCLKLEYAYLTNKIYNLYLYFVFSSLFLYFVFCILRVYLHYISGSSPLKDDHSLATLPTDSVQHTF